MKATFEPTKAGTKLNVRKGPFTGSPVVGKIEAGEHDCISVERGWVKFADGYADARYLTVTDGAAAEPDAKAVDEPAEKPEEKGPEADDDRAALKKMTNPQLYKLAEQSGIHVAKGSTKAELIDAILAGADD